MFAVTIALLIVFAAGFFVLLYMNSQLSKSGKANHGAEEETLMDKLSLQRESYEARLRDKDGQCELLLKSKDEWCAKLLSEKDEALKHLEENCRLLINEKGEEYRKRLAEKEEECCKRLQEKDEQCRRLIHDKNTDMHEFFAEKEKSFAKSIELLREQFTTLAAEKLKNESGSLQKFNSEHIDAILKPLREQMQHLATVTQKAEVDRANLKASITENVNVIGDIAAGLAKTADALKSNTRIQGRAGEEILADKLRQAGLEENLNFFLQTGTSTDRPDAEVCDSEGRRLVIDSKVSLTAYMEYAAEKDEKIKKAKLQQHIASVKQKIDQLAKKKYPVSLSKEFPDRNYLPVTAMFVPYEAPLMEALKEDASLQQFAAENNVVLITPLTLLAYLRLVYLAWQHEKESRNRDEIVNVARELLTRMNAFLMAFQKLGGELQKFNETFEEAKGIIVDAPRSHSIAKAAKNLINLGVKLETKKGKRIEKADVLV
jgi:DNA recombination protein RmuC